MSGLQPWTPTVVTGDVVEDSSVLEATKRSLAATKAEHTPADEGARATLLVLAEQVDYLRAHDWLTPTEKLDNVTIPTYLRYCDALHLTPASRARKDEKSEGKAAGKLASMKRQQRPTG